MAIINQPIKPDSNTLVYSSMLLVLVNVARVQELFPFLIHLRVGLLFSLWAVFLFVMTPKKSNTPVVMRITQVKMVLAIYLLCLLSVPMSVWQGQSFKFLFPSFSSTIFFFLMIVFATRSYADLRKIVWALISGVLLLALFSIYSGVGGSRLSASSTYDANDIALVFVVTLPMIYFFMTQVRKIPRIFLFVSLLVLLYACIGTSSRGGFLGLLSIVPLLMFKDDKNSWGIKLLVFLALFFAFFYFAQDSYWERMNTITSEDDYNVTHEAGRLTVWRHGIDIMLQRPFGCGVGAFDTAIGLTFGSGPQGIKWSAAHNSFVQIAAELGFAGFLLFISLIFFSFRCLRVFRLTHQYEQGEAQQHIWLASALETSLLGYCVCGFFLSMAYSPILYLIFALSTVLHRLGTAEMTGYLGPPHFALNRHKIIQSFGKI